MATDHRLEELRGQLLLDRGKHEVAAVAVADVAQRRAQLPLPHRLELVREHVELRANHDDRHQSYAHLSAVLVLLPALVRALLQLLQELRAAPLELLGGLRGVLANDSQPVQKGVDGSAWLR